MSSSSALLVENHHRDQLISSDFFEPDPNTQFQVPAKIGRAAKHKPKF